MTGSVSNSLLLLTTEKCMVTSMAFHAAWIICGFEIVCMLSGVGCCIMASRDGQHVDKLIKQDQLLSFLFPHMVFFFFRWTELFKIYVSSQSSGFFFRRLKPVLQDLRKFVFQYILLVLYFYNCTKCSSWFYHPV